MPVIGIMRNIALADIPRLLQIVYSSGLTTIEITMNSPGAEESIRSAIASYGEKMNIGAGTVCTEEDLDKALAAGAVFIVTPIINEKVITKCKQLKVPIFAGAFTPTEIFNAWTLGADMVKVFPATGNAIEYMKAVKGPFPQIKLLPTGGVGLENATSFLKAGATGLGIGSELFDKNYLQQKDWDGLAKHVALFTKTINTFFE